MKLSQEDCVERYGKIENGKWANEIQWMVFFDLTPFNLNIINEINNKPLIKIYCNKDIVEPLTLVLKDLIDLGLDKELKTFGGCYCIRMVRGYTNKLSTHSYGTAIDWRTKEMPLGSNSLFSVEFINVWKKHGWTWGGDFSRKDPQHFSYAWE